MKNKRGTFYGGTSGLLVPMPKRDFPPEFKEYSRLAFCATLVNSIEINSSFYKLPQPKTVAKWANEVPAGFTFTYKLWREITHNKGLVFNDADIARFMNVINYAADKKGCLLVQLPPGATIARGQLTHLLALLQGENEDQGWRIAVEFRHRSWYTEDVYDLLRRFNAGLVLQDMPKSATPQISTSDDFVYLRFHGPSGNYRGSYSDELLNEYVCYIREWQDEGKDVFVYFNNTAGDALNNLLTLKQYLCNGE
ncbi:DUF72 domain-containing protein [Mucilaginibacter sp. L3T2-6]|uniref:DUF72 domain-containing protein n=1 Tax=Mucilaginibacter sp. L3T2-6 TaxID=3062491 RepID=UPI0026753FF4|nr:DUF72 domain-containing protein [Mucilaginibacter sp. L3T2-6]MDO3644040.1 DUF72 domain-containing protein [Mucilaginibacter sp. L3T2-6]MDV6216491.1 DUF72 domain-containing protein [Mucilaginibacter sp. L3T2-6]